MVICTLSLAVSAENESAYIYEYPELDLTIEFSKDYFLSQDARQMIADSIAFDTPITQTYSLCWLLGHDFYVETVSALYHKRSEYDPLCQLEVYDVEKCTKCDHLYPTLVTSKYVSCCPPEASAVSIDDSHTH